MNTTSSFSTDSAYTVRSFATQRDHTNVIAGDVGYLVELSQWGCGSATLQFDDFEVNQITETNGKLLYLRDDESGEVWTPGWYPMLSEVEEYSCRHEDRGSCIQSVYRGVRVAWEIIVATDEAGDRWRVVVTNTSNRPRKISVVPAVSLKLQGFSAPRFFDEQVQYSICDLDETLNGLYYEAKNPNPRNTRYNAVLASLERPTSYTGNRESFYGAPGAIHYPEILQRKNDLGNRKGIAGEPFQALQSQASLEPGQTLVFHYYSGVFDGRHDAREQLDSWRRDPDGQIVRIREAAAGRRCSLRIETPDRKLDAFINLWLKKGLEFGMAKKDATRDNLQFAYGLALADPKRVRRELMRVVPFQYADGHMVRSWVPMDTTYYCDGPLWLILTVCKYLKVSGDLAILDERVAYFDHGEGSVLEHLTRGVHRIESDLGPHGLPLARFADWNDALNIDHPEAESVFMAMGLAVMLLEMGRLMEVLGKPDEAASYRRCHEKLAERINSTCWSADGGYYVRAFAGDEVIGGPESSGSTLFVNPQTWAIIGEVVPANRLERLLHVIDDVIETDLGCPVNTPAYDFYCPDLGRVTAQIPGTWENGSSYCHVTAFKAFADTRIGRGSEAYRSLERLMPDSAENPIERSGALPYTLTSSYSTNPEIYGLAGRPWLTGTQAWFYTTVIEGLLGVRPDYDAIEIVPALPAGWSKASLTVFLRGAEYSFRVRRGAGDRRLRVTVDGEPASSRIGYADSGATVAVDVVVGGECEAGAGHHGEPV